MGATLGEFEKCSICGEYGWTKTHKCPPRHYVWVEDNDDIGEIEYSNSSTVRAMDEEDAALKFMGQNYDHTDGGTVLHVLRADKFEALVSKFDLDDKEQAGLALTQLNELAHKYRLSVEPTWVADEVPG